MALACRRRRRRLVGLLAGSRRPGVSSALAPGADSASKKVPSCRCCRGLLAGDRRQRHLGQGVDVVLLMGMLLVRGVLRVGTSEVQGQINCWPSRSSVTLACVDRRDAVAGGQQRADEVARAVGGDQVGGFAGHQRGDALAGVVEHRWRRRRQRLGGVAHGRAARGRARRGAPPRRRAPACRHRARRLRRRCGRGRRRAACTATPLTRNTSVTSRASASSTTTSTTAAPTPGVRPARRRAWRAGSAWRSRPRSVRRPSAVRLTSSERELAAAQRLAPARRLRLIGGRRGAAATCAIHSAPAQHQQHAGAHAGQPDLGAATQRRGGRCGVASAGGHRRVEQPGGGVPAANRRRRRGRTRPPSCRSSAARAAARSACAPAVRVSLAELHLAGQHFERGLRSVRRTRAHAPAAACLRAARCRRRRRRPGRRPARTGRRRSAARGAALRAFEDAQLERVQRFD